MMPEQKPGRSKQDYGTPPEFLAAVKKRLFIKDFIVDVAASEENTVCPWRYYDEIDNGLNQSWAVYKSPYSVIPNGWAWCNPPYSDIQPWLSKAIYESKQGANTAVLIPASVGANWWREYVEPFAYQVFLNGRLTFVGETKPYPKDCALLLYTPFGFRGNEVWNWKRDVPQLQQPEPSED